MKSEEYGRVRDERVRDERVNRELCGALESGLKGNLIRCSKPRKDDDSEFESPLDFSSSPSP